MRNQYFIGPSPHDSEKAFLIDVHLDIPEGVSDLFFPYWRPGRYEPGNFVKWSRNFSIQGQTSEVAVQKLSPNHWLLKSPVAQRIHVKYEWCFHELNAGSSFMSSELFYVNPVNLCCFLSQSQGAEIELFIDADDQWKYAGGIPVKWDSSIKRWKLQAMNYDHLADTPFVFAPDIQMKLWQHKGVDYYCHSIGLLPKSWQLGDYHDLMKMTNFQQEVMYGLPVSEYHYIFIFTPHRMRHGVEHRNSTMIVMGQGEVSDDVFYDEVLAIASHELFHTWNVKYCRPQDLLPYDFTQAQYSATGLITEGITTYYGDLMLWRSGVWTWEKMANSICEWLNIHVQNDGRFSSSLLDSSIDTWVDGYVKGTLGRKVSIYNEGALLAFVTDVWMLNVTEGKKSLDDVMHNMIERFNVHGVGYTLEDYWQTINQMAGADSQKWQFLATNPVEYQSEVLGALHWIGQETMLNMSEGVISWSMGMCSSNHKLSAFQRALQY
jgi:predicted metalloprotease with PDZ domain